MQRRCKVAPSSHHAAVSVGAAFAVAVTCARQVEGAGGLPSTTLVGSGESQIERRSQRQARLQHHQVCALHEMGSARSRRRLLRTQRAPRHWRKRRNPLSLSKPTCRYRRVVFVVACAVSRCAAVIRARVRRSGMAKQAAWFRGGRDGAGGCRREGRLHNARAHAGVW